MNPLRSITLYLVLLALLPQFLSEPITITVPFEKPNAYSSDPSQNYYSLSLTNRPIDHDVLISVESIRQTAPKVYVTKTDNQAQAPQNSQYSSTSSAGSMIHIPNADLMGVQTLYIAMTCALKTCDVNLRVDYTKEIVISATEPLVVSKEETQMLTSLIARLNIPSVDANRIIIHVDALTANASAAADLNVAVGPAPTIPIFSQVTSIPRAGWFEGRTAVIYQGDSLFCTECQYILNLHFVADTEIRIDTQILAQELRLDHESFLDAVKGEKYNTYYYQVSEQAKDKDVVLSLQAAEGDIEVYIDCGVEAEKYETYKLRYDSGKANEQIVLTPAEHGKCKDMKYTIVVYGVNEAVYSIKAAARDSTNLQLRKDAPVVGTIVPNEEIDYELFVPLFLTEKVSIKLSSPNDVSMSVVNCRFHSECPNLLSGNFEHVKINETAVEPTNFVFMPDMVEGGQELTIDVEKNGCYALLFSKSGMLRDDEKEKPVCAFKVVLKSKASDPVSYSLSAAIEGHQLLYSGVTEKGVVYKNETQYYLLYVEQEELLSVQFQLTVLSGNAKMFVSRNNPYPNVTEEANVEHEGAVVYKNLDSYKGVYYVAVQGISTSAFLISPTVISPNSQPEDYATMLEEGVQHKGVLVLKQESNDPDQFYNIKLNLQDSWNGKIRINVNSLGGRLIIAANNDVGSLPSRDTTWVSNTNTLEISSDDPRFERQAIYHIGIYRNLDDVASENLREITYTISYTVISTTTEPETGNQSSSNQVHILMTTAFPHHGVLQGGHTLYFKILLHLSDLPVTLFKQASSRDIDIYLTTDPNKKYPGPQDYEFTTAKSHKDELTLQKSDLTACVNENATCPVYFAVTTSYGEEVPFTLSLHSHSTQPSDETRPIPLEDGKERQFKVPPLDKPVYFYFYPTPSENITIDVYCPNKEVSVFTRLGRLFAEGDRKTDPNYPTNNDYEYSSLVNEDSLHSGAAHVTIPVDPELKIPLVVTIAVYFRKSARPTGSNISTTTFSIVASAQTRHIYPGKTTRAQIEENSYLYFVLDVPKKNCTLFITMTNIDDGDSDVYVSFGDYVRPTKEDHKLASSSRQRTELLEINQQDIFPETDMSGTWVIGVYGKRQGSFTLTASYEGEKMVQLQEGVPVEMYLKKEAVMYFKYLHARDTSFDIRVDKQSGDLGVYVIALDPRQESESVLPTGSNAIWKFTEDKQSFLNIDSKDPKFCSDCLYIIGIEVTKSSKFSVLITEVGGITLLQSGIRYSDRLKPKEKKHYMLLVKNFDELSLSASIAAGQLDIYGHNNLLVNKTLFLWQMHLNPESTYEVITLKKEDFWNKQHVSSYPNGEEYVISQENVFYFEFENPGDVNTEYSFSMHPPNSTVVLTPNEYHDVKFKALEDRSFLYYSSHVTGSINIALEYCLLHKDTDRNETLDEKMTEYAEGFDSEINYWPEKATVGVGSEVSLLKDDVMIKNTFDTDEEQDTKKAKSVCIKQSLEIEDQDEEGRYELIFTNPYDQELDVSIRIDPTELNLKSVDRNYHGMEHFGLKENRTYQVTYAGNGYAYLDFYACSGVTSIKMADSLEALRAGQVKDVLVSQFGGQRELFFKSKVDKSTKKYFTVTTHDIMEQFGDQTADVMITTSYFPKDTGEYKTSEPHEDHGLLYESQLSHNYDMDRDQPSLTLNFTAIAVPNTTSDHNMMFYIRLCPKGAIQNRDNYCVPFNNPKECYMNHQTSSASESKVITQKFDNVKPGEYDLHIYASMSYEDTSIRPFAYKAIQLSLGQNGFVRLRDVMSFIIIMALFGSGSWLLYKRLTRDQVVLDRGRNMKNMKKTRPTYGFVGDDEDDDEDEEKSDEGLKKVDQP